VLGDEVVVATDFNRVTIAHGHSPSGCAPNMISLC
jgi:hypothetical protein